MDLFIESSGSNRSWIKRILVIGRTNYQDVFILLKAVHFSKYLVDSGAA